jgi:hypothetical protein
MSGKMTTTEMRDALYIAAPALEVALTMQEVMEILRELERACTDEVFMPRFPMCKATGPNHFPCCRLAEILTKDKSNAL